MSSLAYLKANYTCHNFFLISCDEFYGLATGKRKRFIRKFGENVICINISYDVLKSTIKYCMRKL